MHILDLATITIFHSSMSSNTTDHADYFSKQVLRSRRFFLPEWKASPSKTAHLLLVGGGCEWCTPEFKIDRQRLPFLAFEFVARGKGRIRLQGKEQTVGIGHAFFYDPSTTHLIQADREEPMVKYFFNYVGDRAKRLHDDLGLTPGTVIRLLETTRIVSLLEEVIDHAVRGTQLSLRCASAALEHALTLCAEGRQASSTKLDPAYSTYLKCRDHLLRHYPDLPGIEPAAKACHVSPAYFTRLFRRYDHETPLTYLTKLKMTQARLLLNEPHAQVKGVAGQLGYKSAAHFSRIFKKWYGESPTLLHQNP
jgi:AraC family transcriptional regulator, arabinose operon regulatory protein